MMKSKKSKDGAVTVTLDEEQTRALAIADSIQAEINALLQDAAARGVKLFRVVDASGRLIAVTGRMEDVDAMEEVRKMMESAIATAAAAGTKHSNRSTKENTWQSRSKSKRSPRREPRST